MRWYLLDVGDAPLTEYEEKRLASYISADRRKRLAGIKEESAKKRCLAAGLLLSLAFGEEHKEVTSGNLRLDWETIISPDSIKRMQVPVIEKGAKGKPYWEKDSYFNLSHSGRYVFLVVSDAEIGCDIQKRDEKERQKTAKRFFGEKEKKQLDDMEDQKDRTDTFFTLWCRKEALGKYTGEGLGAVLGKDVADLEEALGVTLSSTVLEDTTESYFLAVCQKKEGNKSYETNLGIFEGL